MSNDTELQNLVLEELKWEPSVTAAHIGVAARDGVVTLSGHVDSFMNRLGAERAARRVQGVRAVVEELQVQLPSDTRRTDEQIATAVLDRLAWNVSVPRDAIQVTVERGHVTLRGRVQWHFQKEAAAREVLELYGVTGVTNEIALQGGPDTTSISDDIRSALKRSWYTRPDSITVTATAGKVKLSGVVHSPHARSVAASIAWNAPGALAVENDMTIN
jgi:osmotically-inducible protein OsmY